MIGAAGITVDLNGHTIDGTASRRPWTARSPPSGPTGIPGNSGGYDGLTIKNGTIRAVRRRLQQPARTQTGMANSALYGLIVRDNRFSGISLGSDAAASTTTTGSWPNHRLTGNGCRGRYQAQQRDGNLVARQPRSHEQ